jgi:hypothetical protein
MAATASDSGDSIPVGTVSFEAFREAWLQEVLEGNPPTVEIGRRFARKLLTQWRDIGDSGDDIVYCDGSGDGGIDIAFLDRGGDIEGDETSAEGDTWYLVQSKYGTAFRGAGTLLGEAQKVIDTLDGARPRLSSLAEGLLQRLTTFRSQASDRDRIVLVFGTTEALDEGQKRTLDDVRGMGRQRLGTLFDVEAISIETIYQRSLDEPAVTAHQLRLPLSASLTPSGNDLLVGAVSLLDLYAFLKQYRSATGDLDQLYEKNVRRFLGGRGRVNKAIQHTLQVAPDKFGLYNNGITIVVEDFEAQEADKTILIEPYVVNGCQTTRTIWDVCHSRLEAGGTGSSPEMEAWRQRAEAGAVVVKIVRVGAGGDDLLREITRFTNSQNAVREKDFLALSSDFKVWARQMGERHGIFLEIQRGAWDSRRAFQQQHPSAMPQFSKAANAFDLLKVYGSAWLGEPGTAFGTNAPFLPNGSIFKRIVNNTDGGEPFDMDDLYAGYRLQYATDQLGFGRGAAKSTRRQTRYLFYFAVGDLLRDVLVRAQVGGAVGPRPKDLTRAFIGLSRSGQETGLDALLSSAADAVDAYLTQNAEDSVFDEPVFRNNFNFDLNGYLKWEQLGKSDAASPRLRSLLGGYKRFLGVKHGDQPPLRDLIMTAASWA